jgi:hypothetical protein
VLGSGFTSPSIKASTPGSYGRLVCSEHGPISHLFELILVIHVNTNNGTNHFVEHVFVGISRSHGCYHMLTYHDQVNMSYHKLTYHGHVRLPIAKLRT